MNAWRLILSGANDAFLNMALDEALLLSCQKGLSPPVLRLYQWSPPAVSMGYFQPAARTVDLEKCVQAGIQVVRRITGGRAVLHEDEITYSVCASTPDSPRLGESTMQTYRRLSMALLHSLRVLGIDAEWVKPCAEAKLLPLHAASSKPCFSSSSRYEITVGGRKLIGSAQRRFSIGPGQGGGDSFLQHGSILTGRGRHSLAELLPNGDSTPAVRRNLMNKCTDLESILKRRVSSEEMVCALRLGFRKVFDCRMEDSVVTQRELQTAQTLSQEKYAHETWNLRR